MPINKKNKLIFIHIPKNGGTSIENYFNMLDKDSFYGSDGIVESGILYSPQHLTPPLLKKHLNDDIYDKCFKFTFIRNPYHRIKSEFFWQQRIRKIGTNTNFKDWFFKFYRKIDSDHKLPQHRYIFDDNGEVMVDFIGRVENMDNDFSTLIEKIKYPVKKSLEKKNKNPSRSTVTFDDDIKYRIMEIYKKDFELFNYEK